MHLEREELRFNENVESFGLVIASGILKVRYWKIDLKNIINFQYSQMKVEKVFQVYVFVSIMITPEVLEVGSNTNCFQKYWSLVVLRWRNTDHLHLYRTTSLYFKQLKSCGPQCSTENLGSVQKIGNYFHWSTISVYSFLSSPLPISWGIPYSNHYWEEEKKNRKSKEICLLIIGKTWRF